MGKLNYFYTKKVRVISKRVLREFWEIYPDCMQQLKSWYQEMDSGNFRNPVDIKTKYPSASFLVNNRVVFNIKGNKYRLIVKIAYKHQMVWIRFIGTHTAYDQIDATTI